MTINEHLNAFSRFQNGSPGNKRGFSLAEVAIAIGILSFALLSVLGLFPAGLANLRQAMDSTTESQIVQRIGAQAALSSFSNLTNRFGDATFYYDQEGQELSGASVDALYRARMQCVADGLAAVGAPAGMNNSLQLVQIEIMRCPGGGSAVSTNNYSIHVASDGR